MQIWPVKARKQHKCKKCGKTIYTDEYYYSDRGICEQCGKRLHEVHTKQQGFCAANFKKV